MGGEAGAEGKRGFDIGWDMSVVGMALGVNGGFGCEDRIASLRLAVLWTDIAAT